MLRQGKSALCVSLAEVQAYARVETGEEEAVLASLLRVASEMCETFINQVLLTRGFEEDVAIVDGTATIGLQPVQAILAVKPRGSPELIDPAAYRIDVNREGRAAVSGLTSGAIYTVAGEVGMASDANDVPEPIRQGILRLAAFLFANRDSAVGDLPHAVTALWRPYRKMSLGS